MNLRESQETPFAFDAFLISVALFGAMVAWLSFTAGQWWNLLGVAAVFGEFLLIWGCFIEPKLILIVRYREALVENPKTWIRLVFLSDLHAGGFKPAAWYARVTQKVQSLSPDIVVMGGDLVVDVSAPIVDLASLQQIRASIGKFYVMGNHDLVDDPQYIRNSLETWGYVCLEDKTLRLEKDGHACDLAGVSDPWFGNPASIQRSSKNVPHITISHEPDMLLDLAKGDTDLMISGHTHGGQVRFPLFGALWPIPAKLGRRVDKGRKVVNGIPCIISNGLGETDGRLRLFTPPHIVCIELGI